ncbi:DUF2335 domain-containing protein [Thioalkalivibrio sp. HK1]|uniref:DUF2335 domain-containing protein n=1 Tax=Thioalkalivibrio sp. HK1 TaxID=1469245 RepID=UPI00046ED23B|nr:DUF2335 domain-containing protein [Thioalkalivibrio sp. HK1]
MSKMRKVSLDEYTEEIKNKRFSDYLDDMLCDPDDSEIIVIDNDSFSRAWQQVGDDLRTAMGEMDEEIARMPQVPQREMRSVTPEKIPDRGPANSIRTQGIVDAGDVSDENGGVDVSADHSNPMPSPKDLAGYKEVLEDAPERILAMAGKNMEARNKALISLIKSHEIKAHLIGSANLIWTIGVLLFAVIAVLEGHPVYAALLLILVGGPRFLKSIRAIFRSDGT